MADYTLRPDLYGSTGGDFTDDLGRVWPDPWGTMAPPSSAPAAPQATGAPAPGAAMLPPPQPFNNKFGGFGPSDPTTGASTDPTGPALPPAGTAAQGAQPLLPPSPGIADKKPAPPLPPPSIGSADQTPSQPALIPTTEHKDSTEGISPEDAARTEAGIGRQQAAQQQADQGTYQQKATEWWLTGQEANRKLANAAAGFADVAAKQAVQDHIAEETDRLLNAGGPNSKDPAGIGSAYWRPDRTELFHGKEGVAFGLMAAVAAMAGSWMQGKHGVTQNAYLPTIMKMIDDNVDQQVRQNSSAMQHLRDIKGSVAAAKLELRDRQLSYVQQQADGFALKDKSEILQAGLAGFRDHMTAEREETRNKQEKVLNRKVTHDVTQKLIKNPAAKAAALPRSLQIRYVQNNQFQEEYRGLRSDVVEAQQNGGADGYLGTVATHGVSWVQEHLNGLPPEQQKFAQTMMKLEELNHLHTGSSMVGLSAEEKERFGKLGIPNKVRDIPNTLQHFDTLYHQKGKENKDMLRGAGNEDPAGEPDADEPEGSF